MKSLVTLALVMLTCFNGCAGRHFTLFDPDFAPIAYDSCMANPRDSKEREGREYGNRGIPTNVEDAEFCYQVAERLGRQARLLPLTLFTISTSPQWDGRPLSWTTPSNYPKYYAPNFPGQQYHYMQPSNAYGPVYERQAR